MIKNLLVIIDVQKCFLNEFSEKVPLKIRNYLRKNKHKHSSFIFTKFVNKPNSQFVKYLKWDGCMPPKEAELADELKEFVNKKNTFEKSTYSIFKSKPIINFIKKSKIKKIYFCGLTSDGCVLASALEGFDLGFEIYIIKELTGTCWGPKGFNNLMLKLLGHKVNPSILK